MNKKVKTYEELEQEKAQKLKDLEQYASPSSSADRAVQQITDLEAAYGQQSQNLAQSRKQEKEDAYVLYQRMQKYMPQYLKSLGMTGLGVSETYASQAMGDYQNNLSSIEQAYRQEQQALDSEKNAAISGIKENYAAEKENERTSIWENVLGYNYTQLLDAMDKEKTENGEVSQETYDKTMAWIEANKDKLPNTVYQQLMAQMQGYQPKVEEESTESASESAIGNNPTFNVNGNTIYNKGVVQTGLQDFKSVSNLTQNKIIENMARAFGSVENIPIGAVYQDATSGIFYIIGKKENGKNPVVYEIKRPDRLTFKEK